jgi:hypothetical protein
VFRVHPDNQPKRMDTALTMENLDHRFRYQGFLDANGDWDTTVYKDEQSTRLLQNYAAARVAARAFHLRGGEAGGVAHPAGKGQADVSSFPGGGGGTRIRVRAPEPLVPTRRPTTRSSSRPTRGMPC